MLSPFILLLNMLPIIVSSLIGMLVALGILGLLWFYIVFKGFRLPNDDEKFTEFAKSIRFTTGGYLIRNILIGIGASIIFFLSVYFFGNIYGIHIWDLDVLLGNPFSPPLYGFGWLLFIYILIPGI